jgi:hypothetical protein
MLAAYCLGATWCCAASTLASAEENGATFYRGVNLNGPSVTIEGRTWAAGDVAWCRCRDKAFENQRVALDPPVDEALARMIRSSRWGGNRVEIVDLPAGPYFVYLYVWEDNNPETFDLFVNGREVVHRYRSGPAGRWEKLGPWNVEIGGGPIEITSRGGAANFSGLEIWRGRSPVQPALSAEVPTADAPEPEAVAFFESRIRPLLVKHCYECHAAGSKEIEGELLVDSRDALRRGGVSGPAIVPGDPARSLLLEAVRYKNDDLQMPPAGKLGEQEIADLERWIRDGAADPRTTSTLSAVRGIDFAKGREFWSLRPVIKPRVPATRDAGWARNDVDRFVLAELDTRGLRPSPPADAATWLRRVTYDLTGLPPTPEEIDGFLKKARGQGSKAAGETSAGETSAGETTAGETEAAYAEVVDRLLATRAYGERWGRHWLDVVRYADTAGDNSDYPVPQLYKYRNWVIDAVAQDLPYDDFVRAQLAGDLLPARDDATRRANLIATGYLAGTRRFGSYEDNRYPWHLTIEDSIDNLGRTFLGLTIGCCRCHDHKFDPLSNEDYYALYGFFQSTRYPWPGIELDKAPHDLVPLVPAEVVAKADGERSKKLADFDARRNELDDQKKQADDSIKRLEKASSDGDRTKHEADLAAAVKEAQRLDEAIKKLRRERDLIAKQALPYETAYAVADIVKQGKRPIGDACVQIKGDPERLGSLVPRRFPTVLGGQSLPAGFAGSGRRELAEWIVDSANPLTARVMVNRIWLHHFGRGLVATPGDFGKQGSPPSHPALLDYLAGRFVENGWSLKAMHRLIVLSQTYRQSSADSEAARAIDPENVFLWRYSPRRLDAESLRDTLLAVAGNLDASPGEAHPFPDQSTWDFTQHKPFKADYDTRRRSVYLMTQRIQRHPFLGLFDGADTNAGTHLRLTSTTPLQALYLMNDPFVHEQAEKLAARLAAEAGDDVGRIERAYLSLFGRSPSDDERTTALEYLAGVRAADGGRVSADRTAWSSLLRGLFLSNELVYVR